MQSPAMQSVTQAEAGRIATVFADKLNVPATMRFDINSQEVSDPGKDIRELCDKYYF